MWKTFSTKLASTRLAVSRKILQFRLDAMVADMEWQAHMYLASQRNSQAAINRLCEKVAELSLASATLPTDTSARCLPNDIATFPTSLSKSHTLARTSNNY